MSQKANFPRSALNYLRWSLILLGFSIVIPGWINSVTKYFAGKTSISKALREYEMYRYPSITFCHEFRGGVDLVDVLRAEAAKNKTFEDVNLTVIIDSISLNKSEIFSVFYYGGGFNDNLIERDELWTESVPHHQISGKCFTYDPPTDTFSGTFYGITFGLKLEDLGGLKVFVHERGSFDVFTEDEMPSSVSVDIAKFRTDVENSVVISKKVLGRLSGANGWKCSNITEGVFRKCFQRYLAEDAGCQTPWAYLDDIDIPMCRNLTALGEKFQGPVNFHSYWPFYSRAKRSSHGGCTVPCTESAFDVDYSYFTRHGGAAEIGSAKPEDTVAYLWFKKFRISHEYEYLVCDFTCLLGEIGGNMGFFLGGSVLTFYDVLHTYLAKRLE